MDGCNPIFPLIVWQEAKCKNRGEVFTIFQNSVFDVLLAELWRMNADDFSNNELKKALTANITIALDSFGVLHIYGQTDAEAAYGLAQPTVFPTD
jgi:predicted oxidoreductase